MKSAVEPLEGNRVKVSVEVDEAEFERDLDAAFRRISREVRLPGFRPGKAPRRVLEAKLGKDVGREEALREALPTYYSQAVRENDVDVIAAPEIEITAGKDDGPVTFDAVVEVRPVISVGGYQNLRVEIPRPEASDEEIDAQIDRLRDQFGELTVVDRPAIDGDHATITINGSRDGEDIAGLQADDYLYEVGSGSIASELDEHLRGSKVGDILTFPAQPADPEEAPVQFRVIVKDVKQKVLPEVTDEWANDVSEFDTVEELRADLGSRISRVRKMQAQMAARDKVAIALADLVDQEPPEAMVNGEVQQRLQDLGMRLSAQGVTAEQYLEATGQTQQQLGDELRELAAQAVRVDLALRAVADSEDIEATDEDLDEEFARVAERLDQDAGKVREEFERAEQVPAVRSDIRKRKALDWLVEHVELVDEDGQPIDRKTLETEELELEEQIDDRIDEDEIGDIDDVEADAETAEQDSQ